MQPDPLFTLTGALCTAVILASAATHKVRAPARFSAQLQAYQLLPSALVRPIARGLPWLELALAFALLLPLSRTGAAWAAAALLALYATAMAINLWRGRKDIDCGCAGPHQRQPIRPLLLIRNGLLVTVALLAAWQPESRALGLFDAFVVLAASAVALLIYAAADGLLANSPGLLKLIGR